MVFYQFVADHAAVIGLSVTTIGAFACAFLAKAKHDRMAKVLAAFVTGARAGIEDAAEGKSAQAAIVDGIMAAAKDYGVEDHAADHVDVLAAPLGARP